MISVNVDTLKTKSLDFSGAPADLKAIVETLEFELKQSQADAVGLSAIQIGIPERVAVIRVNHKVKLHEETREIKENYDLYNAKIVSTSNPFIFKGEGCLSFPDESYDTERYNEIEIVNGDGKEYKFSGYVAIIVQHELDHWDGIVIADRQV